MYIVNALYVQRHFYAITAETCVRDTGITRTKPEYTQIYHSFIVLTCDSSQSELVGPII